MSQTQWRQMVSTVTKGLKPCWLGVIILGVLIDEHLAWDVHIDNLKSKISKTCGIINKVKHKLPRSVLLLIYNSLLLPYLQYCAMIWVCNVNNQSNLNSLLVTQKRAIRNICLLNYRDHTAYFFNELNLLKVEDIGLLQVSQFMYKANHMLLPIHFCSMFARNSATHHYNTRQSEHLHIITDNSTKKLDTITHFGPRYWNNLPTHIKEAPTLSLFTKRLKSHLISLYVWCCFLLISSVLSLLVWLYWCLYIVPATQL